MTVVDSGYNDWVGDFGSYIKNPPNSQLRWEKTANGDKRVKDSSK